MLFAIIGILLALWLVGLLAHVAGGLIHLLLVFVVIIIVYQLISGRSNDV